VLLGAIWATAGSSSAFAALGTDLLLRASTYNGVDLPQSFYNKLDLAFSTDGVRWQRLSTQPVLNTYSRDASIVRHGSDYVTVYTDAFTSPNGTFGLARSTDLMQWTTINVKLQGPLLSNATPNNVWAPEWFVDDGRYFVLVRLSTTSGNTYGPPGIGYLECLDPGTWTNWTDFKALPELSPVIENDPFIIKVDDTYHLFTDHWDFGQPGHHAILHRKSTNGPFSGYGPPTNIATNFIHASAFITSGVQPNTAWEGQFILPLSGNGYRLFFQAALRDMSFFIDSTDGMQTWDLASMRQLFYDREPAFGHGSVLAISGGHSVPNAAIASFVSRSEDLQGAAVAQVQAEPRDYGLYSVADYQANRIAGQNDVTASPSTYGLFTMDSIMDLNMGGVVMSKGESGVSVQLQVTITTNLAQGFTNTLTNISFPVFLPGDKHFLRIRALGPQ